MLVGRSHVLITGALTGALEARQERSTLLAGALEARREAVISWRESFGLLPGVLEGD